MSDLAKVVGRIEPECTCSCHDFQDGCWCGHCCHLDDHTLTDGDAS